MTTHLDKRLLTRRSFLTQSALAAGTVLGTGSFLAACSSSAATSATQQPVVLKLFHWFSTEVGSELMTQINNRFHAENPHITVQFSSVTTDQYETVLKARLAGGDAPDIFGVFPGTKFYPYAKAGYLADLSDQPWVSHVLAAAKRSSSYKGKVYLLPLNQNAIGVVYNKDIFQHLRLSVPTSWQDFLTVCQKIKAAGIVPIALGNKDLWIDQLIPYAMAPSAIYSNNPDFDQQMYAGKATFVNSPWVQMMKDYLGLNASGYFNTGVLGTTYAQTSQLVAGGKAAMVVNGNWIISQIRDLNASAHLGMFALPYVQLGKSIWVAASVGNPFAVSASTQYPAEAKKYLEFWTRQDVMGPYLQREAGISTLDNISNPALDPAVQELLPALKVGSYGFLDNNWPVGPQDVMQKDIQSVFASQMSVSQMLQDMDTSFQQNKASVS